MFFRIRLAEFEVDVVARFDLHDVEPDHFAGLDHAPVPAGGVADLALEQSGEIVLVGEVEVGGDLLDRPAGAVEQLLSRGQFSFQQILVRGFPEVAAEDPGRLDFGTVQQTGHLRQAGHRLEDLFLQKLPQQPPFVADGMVDILPGQDIVGDLGDDRADDLRTERQMGLFRMPARLLEPFGEEFRAGKIDG